MSFYEAIVIIISGTLGSVGFTFVFKSKPRNLPINAVGGFLVCVIYVFCVKAFENEFFENVFPAAAATVFAEIMARKFKTPATPILACSIIALVPGGKLYYTIYYFLTSEMELCHETFLELLRISGGLAVGIILVSAVVNEINRYKYKEIFNRN